MKRFLVGCLLLTGCESAELSAGGMQVRAIPGVPDGCRLVGTIRDKEGGGLRSLEENRALVGARLRNEAARLGGDALAVIEEARGDTEDGQAHFATGVAGMTTPSQLCTNCVLVTARVFQCGGQKPGAEPAPGGDECVPARPAPPAAPAQEDD